jgi:hypothetical protein
VSLLARARKFNQEREAWRTETKSLENLRDAADRLGVGLVPIEQLETIDWPWAIKAAALSFLRCRRAPDSESLDAAAALLLQIVDASEKQEKGEKPEIRYGLTHGEARALLLRIYRGQRVRLTDCGQIETVGG